MKNKYISDMMTNIIRKNTTKFVNNAVSRVGTIIASAITSKAIYAVNLNNVQYSIMSSLTKHFKLSRNFVEYRSSSDGIKISYDRCANYRGRVNRSWSKNTIAATIYRDTPIILMCGVTPEDIFISNFRQHDNDDDLCAPDSYDDNAVILLTIKTDKNIANMKRFISLMIKESIATTSSSMRSQLYITSSRRSHSNMNHRFRTFDDTFIADKDMNAITHSLDRFKCQRAWYDKNNIPYHFGILLYGKPASGKTSVAQAIAHYMKSPLYVVSGDNIYRLPNMFGMEIPQDTICPDLYTIVLVEDIDCGFAEPVSDTPDDSSKKSERDGFRDYNRRLGLASLLNCIDGMNAPKNTIFIFTTNHIDKLDPALIRPGRIDLKIEINGITNETFDKFCKFHYGKTYDGDININDELTFADLQLEVMKGSTLDELVKYVRKE